MGYPMEDGRVAAPPNYDRVVRQLTDEELEDEILGKRGTPGYQEALVREHGRRAETPPVAS